MKRIIPLALLGFTLTTTACFDNDTESYSDDAFGDATPTGTWSDRDHDGRPDGYNEVVEFDGSNSFSLWDATLGPLDGRDAYEFRVHSDLYTSSDPWYDWPTFYGWTADGDEIIEDVDGWSEESGDWQTGEHWALWFSVSLVAYEGVVMGTLVGASGATLQLDSTYDEADELVRASKICVVVTDGGLDLASSGQCEFGFLD